MNPETVDIATWILAGILTAGILLAAIRILWRYRLAAALLLLAAAAAAAAGRLTTGWLG